MNIKTTRKSYPPVELLILEHGDPVAPDRVQASLTELWRTASGEFQSEEEGALALASLWNLVAFHKKATGTGEDSAGGGLNIRELLEQVTISVPARVINLEECREEGAAGEGKEVEAWVATFCLHPPSGPNMVCCEQINLACYGEKGHSHFPALVRALLTPDLPAALLWLEDVPRRGHLLGQLLQISDRIIIDNQHTTESDSILAVNDLIRNTQARLVDLGWLRLGALRYLIADFFDPPGRAGQLERIERILIETSPQGRNTGFLLLGWLLSRCGYDEVQSVDLGSRSEARRWNIGKKESGGGAAFPLDFKVREGYGGMDGVFLIEIQAGGDTFALEDTDPEHMSVKGPDGNLPSVALRENADPELLVAALGRNTNDPVFNESLAMAAMLVEAEQWNR